MDTARGRRKGEACAADGGLVRAGGPDRVGLVGRAATPEAKWGVVVWELNLRMDGNKGELFGAAKLPCCMPARHGYRNTPCKVFQQ